LVYRFSSPDVKKAHRLLFVSDYYPYHVDIFTMPDLALKGTLTGFYEPRLLSGFGVAAWCLGCAGAWR
jgi:hypothetical protein